MFKFFNFGGEQSINFIGKIKIVGVIVNYDCQFDGIQNDYGDILLGMLVRVLLENFY